MYRRHHHDHTAHGNIAAGIWCFGVFLSAGLIICVLAFIINVMKEHAPSNEGLSFNTQWDMKTAILPKEGYQIDYVCLIGDNKLTIKNVIKIIPEDKVIFTSSGKYQIDNNCFGQIIKEKQ